MIDYNFDKLYMSPQKTYICGIDEAGRGPLWGPVFAAACILPVDIIIDGLDDSKKISEKKRNSLFEIICSVSLSYAVSYSTSNEIDEYDILNATMLAMNRAVNSLSITPDYLIIDGNISRGFEIPNSTIVKGDSKSQSIAAASILAKVSRDKFCYDHGGSYSKYNISKNKGYPTKEHRKALLEYGLTNHHRKSFCHL